VVGTVGCVETTGRLFWLIRSHGNVDKDGTTFLLLLRFSSICGTIESLLHWA